jgi:hypothetical protein
VISTIFMFLVIKLHDKTTKNEAKVPKAHILGIDDFQRLGCVQRR